MASRAEATLFGLLESIHRGHLVVRDDAGHERSFGREGETPHARFTWAVARVISAGQRRRSSPTA